MNKIRHIFKNINEFSMNISYVDIDSISPLNVHDHHIHDECEIYINLSGDVSFSVENSFYPIMPGNIIITRPYEYHHCIYHSDKRHKHFWILFHPSGNEELFDIFFKRELGKNNLLIVDPQKSEELIKYCRMLTERKINESEKYFCFFNIINILNNADAFNAPQSLRNESIIKAVNFINDNLASNFSIKELSDACNISISTLERCFYKSFNISPSEYIKKRRLANATKMLYSGYSVTDTAYLCGFSDCSRFIASFKKEYKMTPLQYKKKIDKI